MFTITIEITHGDFIVLALCTTANKTMIIVDIFQQRRNNRKSLFNHRHTQTNRDNNSLHNTHSMFNITYKLYDGIYGRNLKIFKHHLIHFETEN